MMQPPRTGPRAIGFRRRLLCWLAGFVWILVLLSVPALCIWSSHKRVTVTLVACNRAAAEPETGAVHPYPGSPPDRLVGELCEVWFTTDVALEDLTRVTHHHHFSLRPCGDTEDTGTLWMGSIYAAHSTDAASHPGGTHLYKAYFPLSFARLREHAHGLAHRNPEQVIESAIRRGLCIRVGGGQMWGVASLASNAMRVPVVFTRGDALVIDDG